MPVKSPDRGRAIFGKGKRRAMIQLGERQKLQIISKVEFGVYLAPSAEEQEDRVLLPIRQVPEQSDIGDILEVFVYRDSQDRLIATVRQPKLTVGQVAELKVLEAGKIGAFLDWGLEKDLLLPFREQTWRVKQGDNVAVALYIDKSGRLCATMRLYPYLRTDSPYKKEDRVTGVVYEVSDNFGAFVAVDNVFSGLIPQKELYGKAQPGMVISARVSEVRPDGKLTLSIREKAYIQIEKDAEEILRLIDDNDGLLPFGDKASPERIRQETGMSKNEFKRAVGNLLKAGKIELEENSIRRKHPT